MQTILGANGQIADELAKELNKKYTSNLRLVSRNPKKINETDSLFSADLMDAGQTNDAVKGSSIVYLTVGLPMDSKMWHLRFPIMMKNVIEACKLHKAKLVYFDNTYMYPQSDQVQTENIHFEPNGSKGKTRELIVSMLLKEIELKTIEAVICRAPEFYGPGKTQSITNSLIFDNIKKNKELKVLLKDDKLRTLIWTPDASKAMALIGNTPDAYNQTWHLPCDMNRLTYKQFIEQISEIYGRPFKYKVIKKWMLKIGSIFNKRVAEIQELLKRYEYDNLFDSSKFNNRFPEFKVTTYKEGIALIKQEQNS